MVYFTKTDTGLSFLLSWLRQAYFSTRMLQDKDTTLQTNVRNERNEDQTSQVNFTQKIMKTIDGRSSFDLWLEIFLAEVIGTGALMYFGCMGLFTAPNTFVPLHPLQGGVVWGFTVCSIIVAFGHISKAHLNPSVTLCSLILGSITPFTAVVYLVSEIIGAVLGMYLMKISVPRTLYDLYNTNTPCGFCATALHPDLNVMQGFLIEFLCTSMLIVVVCSVWDPRNAKINDSVAVKFGLLITVLSIVGGQFTGTSMNPARSLAPAIVNNNFTNHWIYWTAPLFGSAVTTLFYKYAFMSKVKATTKGAAASDQDTSAMLKSGGVGSVNGNDSSTKGTNLV